MSTPKINVSKLVTYTNCTDLNSVMRPLFTYTGRSRSMQTDVEISYPSHQENMMFYEHFLDDKAKFPFKLSMLCLGKDASGKIVLDFGEYKHVKVVEFSREIKSVNLMMQVVSKLPKCREVKVFLDDKNISLAAEDSQVGGNFTLTSETVQTLKIIRLSGTKDPHLDICSTKLEPMLRNAYLHWPQMKFIYIDGLEGGGKTYDFVCKFCEVKKLPAHSVKLKDGQVFCKPLLVASSTPTGLAEEPSGQRSAQSAGTMRPPPSTPLVGSSNTNFIPSRMIKTEGFLNQLEQQQPIAATCPNSTTMMTAASTSLIPTGPSNSLASLRSVYDDSWGVSSDEETEKVPDVYSTSPPVSTLSEPSDDTSLSPRPSDTMDNSEIATRAGAGVQISVEELQSMLEAARRGEETSQAVAVEQDEVKFIEGVHFVRRNSRKHN